MFQYDRPLGRLVRLPLKAIPRDVVFPVLSGPNRGLRWVVGAGTHGCWLGRYERQEIDSFLSRITPESVVWDIGAHAGFFTMACARRCRHVVACEPQRQNAAYLTQHLQLNKIANVSVVRAAIGDLASGFVAFGGSPSSYQNRIGSGTETVSATCIDALVSAGHPPPTTIKMDIEGAEASALAGGRETFALFKPDIMLAFHSDALRDECRNLLVSLGYHVTLLNVATFWGTAKTQ